MADAVFVDKGNPPTDADLARVLGEAKEHWDAVVGLLERAGGGLRLEWKFYGKAHGWQLKALVKKRSIAYLVPRSDRFTAATALGEQALGAAREGDLPADLLARIEAEKTYPEGRPARLEVTRPEHVEAFGKLLALKLGSR